MFQMLTDYSFYYPFYKSLKYLHDRIPVYLYKFSYRGQYSYSNSYTGNGVVHGDDLIFLFDSPAIFKDRLNENDQMASDVLISMLTQFAKLGDINLAKCSDMRLMCKYTHFYKNATGLIDKEETTRFDFKSVELWDHLEEIISHQRYAGRSKRQIYDDSTTEVFGSMRYAPEESNNETGERPSRKGRFNELRDILKNGNADPRKK